MADISDSGSGLDLPVRLLSACSEGDEEAAKQCLQHIDLLLSENAVSPLQASGIVNVSNPEGWTPLLFAVHRGATSLVRHLLDTRAGAPIGLHLILYDFAFICGLASPAAVGSLLFFFNWRLYTRCVNHGDGFD